MKNISRRGYFGILSIGVALLAVLLFTAKRKQEATDHFYTDQNENRPYTRTQPAPEHAPHQKTKHLARKPPQSPFQWLVGVSQSQGDIHEKLALLQSELPRQDITSLWLEMIQEKTTLHSGQLPGSEKWESEMIFNALLDALVESASKAQAAGETTGNITTLFCQLIATRQNDAVLRDYAIQRSLTLAADSLPADSPDRQHIIHTTLEELNAGNLDQVHTGTALNTLLSFKAQWSPAEHAEIQDRIQTLISTLPENLMADPPATPGTPDLQIRIPLLTAIGGWHIQSAIPHLEQAIHSGQPSLQIPAIAAWSQFPQNLQQQSPLHRQIEAWATSQSPLRYAAEAALSRNTFHAP
jgi:hypothetical protein